MAIENVLVPLDGSEISRSVLGPVHRLASPECNITLLRVIGPNDPEDWLKLRDARTRLLHMVEDYDEEQLKVPMIMERSESPREAILQAIATMSPDLVAMTTNARSGVARLIQGSVAEHVLRNSDAPLLLCTEHSARAAPATSPFHRILVPLDGSEVAETIVPLVAKIAGRFKAEVILMSVTPKALQEGTPEMEEVTARLNHYGRRFHKAGAGQVTLQSGDGDPATAILNLVEANRADLVALSTHGRSGFDRARFGSVAEEVMRRCPCPVLIQRATEADK